MASVWFFASNIANVFGLGSFFSRCTTIMATTSLLAVATWDRKESGSSSRVTSATTCAVLWGWSPSANTCGFHQKRSWNSRAFPKASWSSWQRRLWKKFAADMGLPSLGTSLNVLSRWRLLDCFTPKRVQTPQLSDSGSGFPQCHHCRWAGGEALGTCKRHQAGQGGRWGVGMLGHSWWFPRVLFFSCWSCRPPKRRLRRLLRRQSRSIPAGHKHKRVPKATFQSVTLVSFCWFEHHQPVWTPSASVICEGAFPKWG